MENFAHVLIKCWCFFTVIQKIVRIFDITLFITSMSYFSSSFVDRNRRPVRAIIYPIFNQCSLSIPPEFLMFSEGIEVELVENELILRVFWGVHKVCCLFTSVLEIFQAVTRCASLLFLVSWQSDCFYLLDLNSNTSAIRRRLQRLTFFSKKVGVSNMYLCGSKKPFLHPFQKRFVTMMAFWGGFLDDLLRNDAILLNFSIWSLPKI